MLIHHPRSAAPVLENAATELTRQKRRARTVRTPGGGATVRSKADSNPAQPVRSGRARRPGVHQDCRFGGKRALFLRDMAQTCPPRADAWENWACRPAPDAARRGGLGTPE